jgi:hypothetical protein
MMMMMMCCDLFLIDIYVLADAIAIFPESAGHMMKYG